MGRAVVVRNSLIQLEAARKASQHQLNRRTKQKLEETICF
jgi:hypothetical protein